MGQFKPMVKMTTTEPTIELKLKKGGGVSSPKAQASGAGHKKMADGGGALGLLAGTPAFVGRPAVNAPVRTPGKPPMAARRKAMAAKPAMKDGGKAGGGLSEIADMLMAPKGKKASAGKGKPKMAEVDVIEGMMPSRKAMQGVKGLFGSAPKGGTVTETQKSVSVAPAKKSGGRC